MKRTLATLLATALIAALGTGCDRPDEDDCRSAVENIQRITRTAADIDPGDIEAAVRSCRANASKESVRCMMNARTLEALEACEGDLTEDVAAAADDEE